MIIANRTVHRLNQNTKVLQRAFSLILRNRWKLDTDGFHFYRPGKEIINNKKYSAIFAPWPSKESYPKFTVFSRSGEIAPFESNRVYSPVDVITLLEFSGDFDKCVSTLSAEYLNDANESYPAA